MNYKGNLRKLPIDNHLESHDSLVKWVIDIHNLVNNELGKDKVDYEEALSLYTNEESKLVDHCFKIAVLIIILYFLYLILKK
jgi:hypothetical protein